jgi:hypothetical protein
MDSLFKCYARTRKYIHPAEYQQFWNAAEDMYMSRKLVAAGLCMSKFWMDSKTRNGRKNGPPYVRIGGKCLYRKRDVLKWMSDMSIKRLSLQG